MDRTTQATGQGHRKGSMCEVLLCCDAMDRTIQATGQGHIYKRVLCARSCCAVKLKTKSKLHAFTLTW